MKKLLLFILLVCATVQAYSQEYPKVILSGDYPDPSVMRDGEDYYMTHSPLYDLNIYNLHFVMGVPDFSSGTPVT